MSDRGDAEEREYKVDRLQSRLEDLEAENAQLREVQEEYRILSEMIFKAFVERYPTFTWSGAKQGLWIILYQDICLSAATPAPARNEERKGIAG